MGAEAIKAEFWHQKCHSELSFERYNIVAPLSSWFQNINMPKATQKSSREQPEEEDIIEVGDDDDDEVAVEAGTHGVINPTEAKHHIQCLDKAREDMMARIDGGEVKDILKSVLEDFKNAITVVMPQMAEADITIIL